MTLNKNSYSVLRYKLASVSKCSDCFPKSLRHNCQEQKITRQSWEQNPCPDHYRKRAAREAECHKLWCMFLNKNLLLIWKCCTILALILPLCDTRTLSSFMILHTILVKFCICEMFLCSYSFLLSQHQKNPFLQRLLQL